ncbi:MAG: hypothetical protein WAU00_19570 [Caldilinea sp.]|uniref:hypothetical protein n=1 Tax=Caldilinea sp. TaxID=2293560 RepID=UPI002B9D8A78|nr:hypothetical protein [Caldilinea sp.]
MKRTQWFLLMWLGAGLAYLLLANSVTLFADELPNDGTIPPLTSFTKTMQSPSGSLHTARSAEVVTYTLQIANTSAVSYTARIGITDTLPVGLVVIEESITPTAKTVENNLIMWEVDVKFGEHRAFTYTVQMPTVTELLRLTNTAELYEIQNAWVPTTTNRIITVTEALTVTPWTLYLPLIITPPPKPELPKFLNGDFEVGSGNGWTEIVDEKPGKLIFTPINGYPTMDYGGAYFAWLGGAYNAINELSQPITLPMGYDSLGITYRYWIDSSEIVATNDRAEIRVIHNGGATIRPQPLWVASATSRWVRAEAIDVSSYQGQSIKFAFWAKLNATKNSNFFVDKVELCSNDDDRKPETARRCDNTAVP